MLELLQDGALVALCLGALPLIVVWLVSVVSLWLMNLAVSALRRAARYFGLASPAGDAKQAGPPLQEA